MSMNVLVSSFAPFPTLSFTASPSSSLAGLTSHISARCPRLGSLIEDGDVYYCRTPEKGDEGFVEVRLAARIRGGKGGFGSQLRAAGGRMSSQKTGNNSSCRDLSGRRLSTIKEAKKLAEYIEGEGARKQKAAEAAQEKLEKLERKIARAEGDDGETSGEGSKKRRLEDTEYVEQSKEIVDNVKSAVLTGLLKKKKKPKLEIDQTKVVELTPNVVQAILETPAAAAIATTAAVAVVTAAT